MADSCVNAGSRSLPNTGKHSPLLPHAAVSELVSHPGLCPIGADAQVDDDEDQRGSHRVVEGGAFWTAEDGQREVNHAFGGVVRGDDVLEGG